MNSEKNNVTFDYNAMGHRIAKHVMTANNELQKSTYYTLDAQGNAISVYERVVNATQQSLTFEQAEKHIYGSSRLGVMNVKVPLLGTQNNTYSQNYWSHTIGARTYEFSNHLGNVLSVISDKPIPVDNGGMVDYYLADIRNSQDYSPFGVILRERSFSLSGAEDYRYSFQGQEHDDEIKGKGNSVNYQYRMHDPSVGRFFAVDPLANSYSYNSPYAFSENRVIDMIELEGLETSLPKTEFINGHKTVIQAVDNTSIQKQNLMTIPKVNLLEKKQEPQFKPREFYIQPEQNEMTQRVELAKMNLDNWGQYVIPGGGLLNSYVKGEEISWTNVGLETLAIIPIGKVAVKGGKIIASAMADAISVTIKSSVKSNPKLLKLAKEAFEGNAALSKEANGLMEQMAKGNKNPGIGTKFVEGTKDVYEMRSKGGARVYFRNTTENSIELVGYSSKKNQDKVISELKSSFPK